MWVSEVDLVGPHVPWKGRRSAGACTRARAHAALPCLSRVTPKPHSGTGAVGAATFAGVKQKFLVLPFCEVPPWSVPYEF